MGKRDFVFILLLLSGTSALAYHLVPARRPEVPSHYDVSGYQTADFRSTVMRVNQTIQASIDAESLAVALPAGDLRIARRLAAALAGTVPSLEDIRRFESLPPGERLPWYLDTLLADRRHAEFFAVRWSRLTLGRDDGPLVLFRRGRYESWLADQFHMNRPYDELVRDIISTQGLWTDHPATNFITATSTNEQKNQPDPIRLAGRTTRAFLGLRIDCAQCHNHPFSGWMQTEFEGLSAFFGQTHVGFTGVHDGGGEYTIEEPGTGVKETIQPSVPYQPELLPTSGSRRSQLASWVTHPQNTYFSRALVNRVWALMFGVPIISPVDNIEMEGPPPELLTILADDFTANGYDLRRLIRIIAATDAFARDSALDGDVTPQHEQTWAIFPLTRLRPEQVAGAVLQATNVTTNSVDSHVLFRLIRFGRERDFLARYADSAEDELEIRVGTIPQRLLMMNGKMVREVLKAEPLNATAKISVLSPTDRAAIESAYLSILSRRPSDRELDFFRERFADKSQSRSLHLEDLTWSLLNSTEFSWNH